jgi:hypothetical protein
VRKNNTQMLHLFRGGEDCQENFKIRHVMSVINKIFIDVNNGFSKNTIKPRGHTMILSAQIRFCVGLA